MVVNHVITKNLSSKIFADIFEYHLKYAPHYADICITEAPVARADVYRYHRPQLEKKGLKSPSVITIHFDLSDVDSWVNLDNIIDVLEEADKLICLNSGQYEILKSLGLNNGVVIPHGYNEELFKKNKKIFDTPRKLVLGLVSKRYARRVKGEAYLYDLVKLLSPEKISFILVGQGRNEDAHFLRELGFEVLVFEFLPYRMYPYIYKSIDFLLMTSMAEGGPANLPEALASGCPVLATNVGMVPDLIKHNCNGMILSGDIFSDIELFYDILNNKNNILDTLFEGAFRDSSTITWKQVVDAHFELYNSF